MTRDDTGPTRNWLKCKDQKLANWLHCHIPDDDPLLIPTWPTVTNFLFRVYRWAQKWVCRQSADIHQRDVVLHSSIRLDCRLGVYWCYCCRRACLQSQRQRFLAGKFIWADWAPYLLQRLGWPALLGVCQVSKVQCLELAGQGSDENPNQYHQWDPSPASDWGNCCETCACLLAAETGENSTWCGVQNLVWTDALWSIIKGHSVIKTPCLRGLFFYYFIVFDIPHKIKWYCWQEATHV